MSNPTAVAEAVSVASLPTPYYQDDAVTIYCGDCREILPKLGRFDLLLTDPPYGLGDKLHGGSGEWSDQFLVAPEWDRVVVDAKLIDDAVLIADSAIVWGGNYYDLGIARCWLSWDKIQEHTSGHFELAWTNLDKPTRSFRMCRAQAYGKGKSHPTQKPVALMRWCLSFAPDAETILDPFAGSCTTGVAAKLEGRKATLIELEERYCEIGANRLSQGVLF